MIYRVEDALGQGPYHGDFGSMSKRAYTGCDVIPIKSALTDDKHPSPTIDGLLALVPNTKFGFDSIDSLNKWFDDQAERIDLRNKCHLMVGVYQIKPIQRGRSGQVVFSNRAPRKKFLDIVTLEPTETLTPLVDTPRNSGGYMDLDALLGVYSGLFR